MLILLKNTVMLLFNEWLNFLHAQSLGFVLRALTPKFYFNLLCKLPIIVIDKAY